MSNMAWSQSSSDPEVAVVVPNRGDVSFRWAVNFHSLKLPEHTVSSKTIAPIDLAREESVENALANGAKWLLLLDSDVLPPVDVYLRLREYNLDFVSGMYFAKKDPAHPAMWNINEDGNLSPIVEWAQNQIVDVDSIGLGCALVHRRVFEDVERPWFKWTEGYEPHPWDMRNIDGRMGIGEDFYFCHKVKEEGYNIYVDTSIKCDHEVSGTLNENGYTPISESQQEDN